MSFRAVVMQRKAAEAHGFTLIELMMVVAIIAILMMVMLPGYRNYVLKAKRNMARAELLTVLARQEQFFILNKHYASRLDVLGYSANPYAINANGERAAIESPDRVYVISLFDVAPETAALAFSLRATPQLGQLRDTPCGYLQITSLGVKSAGGDLTSECW